MTTRKDVLFANRRRQPRKTEEVFRRGQIQNSGAVLRGPKADPGAGKGSKELASFVGALIEPLGGTLKEARMEWQKDERARGIATFSKASPEQREKWRLAIKNGTVEAQESPYFREGLFRAHTETYASQYSANLEKAFEEGFKWTDDEGKEFSWNKQMSMSSGSFDAFLNAFDKKHSSDLQGIPDEFVTDEFYPVANAFKDKMRQKNTEFQNSQYIEKANAVRENQAKTVTGELLSDSTKEHITEGIDVATISGSETHSAAFRKVYKSKIAKLDEVNEGRDIVRSINKSYSKIKKNGQFKFDKEQSHHLLTTKDGRILLENLRKEGHIEYIDYDKGIVKTKSQANLERKKEKDTIRLRRVDKEKKKDGGPTKNYKRLEREWEDFKDEWIPDWLRGEGDTKDSNKWWERSKK